MHATIVILVSSLSILILRSHPVGAYLPQTNPSYRTYRYHSSARSKSKLDLSARYIEIPLLDFLPSNNDDDEDPKKKKKKDEILVQPLPSIHLQQQPELSSIHVYGMKLTVPLHQQIINHAWDIAATNTDPNNRIDLDDDLMPQRVLPYNDPTKIPLVGIVAYKPPPQPSDDGTAKHPAIGAIGCVVHVLYNTAIANNDEYTKSLNMDNCNDDMADPSKKKKKNKPIRYNTPSTSKTVLCRGLFRFIVRDIKQSIPYTVALIEELSDENELTATERSQKLPVVSEVSDPFANMTTTEMMQQTLQSMQLVIDRMMENAIQSSNKPLTPLEESILQDNGMIDQQQQVLNEIRETAREYNNIWKMFLASLVDMSPQERYFAVPIMAAEICHFPNEVRRQMLVTTQAIERLRIACRAATNSVTDRSTSSLSTSTTLTTIKNSVVSMDNTVGTSRGGNGGSVVMSQNLNVGTPKLPSWSKKIKKGTILEYYWNEDYGWCRGQVIEDPLRIVPDEIVLTMHFPDDDSTHRLPFSAEEKVRWRPPSSSTPP